MNDDTGSCNDNRFFLLFFFLKISHKNDNFDKFCIFLKVGCLASTGLPVHDDESMTVIMMIIMMMILAAHIGDT